MDSLKNSKIPKVWFGFSSWSGRSLKDTPQYFTDNDKYCKEEEAFIVYQNSEFSKRSIGPKSIRENISCVS